MENLNWPDCIQAFASLVTLALSIVTYIQGKRIKTLTDVTDALVSQNRILIDSLEFQKLLAITQFQPVLSIDGEKNLALIDNRVVIFLKNEGEDALSISVINKHDTQALGIDWQEIRVLTKGAKQKLTIEFLPNSNKVRKIEDFELLVTYSDRTNRKYKQEIKYSISEGNIYLSKPETIISDSDREGFKVVAF